MRPNRNRLIVRGRAGIAVSALGCAVALGVAVGMPILATPPAHAQQFKLPKVDLDYDKLVDFESFKSYSWKDTDAVKGHEGLKGTPSQGQTTLPGGSGQLTTSVDFHKVLEGTLLVELQRATDEKAVWRAATEYRSIDKQRIDAETASAVRHLIAKYPPPKP